MDKRENNAQPKPADLFISYQHDKKPQILALYNKLTSLGYTCWIDVHQIQGGKVLLKEISIGLRGCKVVLCCLTRKYTESKACRQEICVANAIDLPIIPLKLERELQYPPAGHMDLILAELTYIDFYKPNDSIQNHWNCAQFDELKHQIDMQLSKSKSEVVIAHTDLKETEAQDVPPAAKVVPPSAQLMREANNNYQQLKPTTDENNLPLPSPHKKTKDRLFKISDFTKLDRRACEVPQDLYREQLSTLVDYLVDGTKTELERVRVVYRWITAQNLSRWQFRGSASMSKRPETVQEYIFALKNGYISYHGVMAEMCRYASIATKEILGYVKHAKYEPGDELTENDEGRWTAVLIDGAWFLMDVLFSSRKVTGIKSMWTLVVDNGEDANNAKEDGIETEHYDYDEYYFLVNPEELIFSHFPHDESWQLLSRKVTLEEFRQFVYTKAQFFHSKLELVYPCTSVVNVLDGVIDVKVKYPANSDCQFAYRLWLANDGDVNPSDTHNNFHLKDFVFMQSREGNLSFHIEFPTPGKFKLEVFCTNKVADSFFLACSFTMVVENAKKDAKPLPTNDFAVWGPAQKLEALGMTPLTHTDGRVKMKRGEAELRFTAPAVEVTVMPTLHSDKMTEEQLKENVIHRIEDDQVIINVRVPEKGDYVLDIYAKEKGTGKEGSVPHVCSYLLSADTASENPAGFSGSNGSPLGPLASSDANLRLTAVSHPTSMFKAPLEGEVVMTFDVHCTSPSFTLKAELELCKQNEQVPYSGFTYVSTQSRKGGDGGTAKISARFPEIGQYIMKIYGRESDSDSPSLCLVYSYLIIVSRAMENCSPYPVTMAGWDDESCDMIQPQIDQPLLANTTITFRVRILTASGVFVQSSDDGVQTTLIRAPDDEAGVWTGDVATGNAENCLTLFANFNQDPRTSYKGIIQFKVITFRNIPVPVVKGSKSADNPSGQSESEDFERDGNKTADATGEREIIDGDSNGKPLSGVDRETREIMEEVNEKGHGKPDKVSESGTIDGNVNGQDGGGDEAAVENLGVEKNTTSENELENEREETEAEKNTTSHYQVGSKQEESEVEENTTSHYQVGSKQEETEVEDNTTSITSKNADDEKAELQPHVSEGDSAAGKRSTQVNPVGGDEFEGEEINGSNADDFGVEEEATEGRTEKVKPPSNNAEVKRSNSSGNRENRETTLSNTNMNHSKRGTKSETLQTSTRNDYKQISKGPAQTSDIQKRQSGGLSKSGPADVNSSQKKLHSTRRDEFDDDLSRQKEQEERIEKERRWKSKFLEDEERKTMGERGYQVQRHKVLLPKLKEFNDKVKEMNKATKN